MTIKSKIKMLLPVKWRFRAKFLMNIPMLIRGVFYDFWRYLSLSNFGVAPKSKEQYFSILTKDYHKIEKGLSLNNPRPFFGKDAIQEVTYTIDNYAGKFGLGQVGEAAINTLKAYVTHHEKLELQNPLVDYVKNKLAEYDGKFDSICEVKGGATELTKEDIWKKSKIDFLKFSQSRHSVRDFSDEPVDVALIENAAKIAQGVPSVCNRQTCRVHVLSDKDEIQKALLYQNGNRGFNHQIDKLLLVVADLECFTTSGERFQRWIEGGMFAMSLIYGLHSQGLGTCCLNWSVNSPVDKKFRKAIKIEKNEEMIMMIAVGNLPEKLKVCDSARRDTSEVVVKH